MAPFRFALCSMYLLESWLLYFASYILASSRFIWQLVKADQSSRLLLLPPEIILEIFQYLDYRALIDARQTCKALHGITNSERFWANLARDLCSKPGIGKLKYPLGNYSTIELMHWTLRRLRARDQWMSDDPSQPLQFRPRLIDSNLGLYGAELLPGGRWLFIIQHEGTAHILDLERESPQPHFLFKTYCSSEKPLVKFRIWVDETKSELSFRVATHGWEANSKKKTRICIYQIDCVGQGSSWEVAPLTVIQDYPRGGIRSWTALSEKYFLQCFALRDENGQKIGPGSTIVLQLRRYSQDLPNSASKYFEKRVESNGPTSVFFVPGDRVVFAAPTFINIYTISLDQDSTPLNLALLHHIPISQAANLLSKPFIGSRCTYLVGIYGDTFRRVTIKHDHTLPPVVEDLGNLEPLELVSSDVRLGPSASIISQSRTSFEITTYEFCVDRAYFRRKQYDAPDDRSLRIRRLVAFDDSVGRAVLQMDARQGQLMILDLI